MKNWYLLLFILFITGCSEDEREPEFSEIKIEKHYPYFYEIKAIDDIEENTLELFNLKIFPINSIIQLNENYLFDYCPEDLKEELRKCDFEQFTLIISASFDRYEVLDIKSKFGYDNFYSKYIYMHDFTCKAAIGPFENIHLVIDAFSVKKIPDNSKLSYGKYLGFS